jgi:hypothetical protein
MNRIHNPFAWLIGLLAVGFILSGVAAVNSRSGVGVLVMLGTGAAFIVTLAAGAAYYSRPRLHTSVVNDLWVTRRDETPNKHFTLSDVAEGGIDVAYMTLRSGGMYRLGRVSSLANFTARVGDLVTIKRTGGVVTGDWKAEVISVVPSELLPLAKGTPAPSQAAPKAAS